MAGERNGENKLFRPGRGGVIGRYLLAEEAAEEAAEEEAEEERKLPVLVLLGRLSSLVIILVHNEGC